jgi:DNA-binding response OmpR family regulator
MSRILIVNDDPGRSRSLQRILRAECFVPATAQDGPSALAALRQEPYDCVLLNDAPSGTDGLACCRSIRERTYIPIILMSRQDDTGHKILGLATGADDFITEPFDPRELVARIRAVLRGRGEYSAIRRPQPITIGAIVLDPVPHEVRMCGRLIPLTNREYAILEQLAQRAGEAVERDHLFEEVWRYDAQLGGKLLEVYIRRLRRKLEPDPEHPVYLRTVRGFGYRLAPPDEE